MWETRDLLDQEWVKLGRPSCATYGSKFRVTYRTHQNKTRKIIVKFPKERDEDEDIQEFTAEY
jgi:hypothetical protein